MKGKQMKTLAECWQALLDKKALIHEHGISPVELVEGRLCWGDGDGRQTEMSFNYPEDWYIYEYEEPEWYEDIPKGGAVCWVSDAVERPNSERSAGIEVITEYCPNSFYSFKGLVAHWKYATRLTKEEIRVFLNNAPEEEL